MLSMELWEKPLLAAMSADEKELTLDKVPIVCEYAEVFPYDLHGLPLDQQVEFGIDVVPGITPISKNLYRMAPMELQKLKKQLEELE